MNDAGLSEVAAEAPTREGLSWGLCLSTYNRLETLERCVLCALAQTRLPAEIVIVDASDDWESNRARIGALLLATGPEIPLAYLQASMRSLVIQRNQAIEAATADVLFMIDDDSFMHAECAAAVMAAYEQDRERRVCAIAITQSRTLPEAVRDTVLVRKDSGRRTGVLAQAQPPKGNPPREIAYHFFRRELFMMDRARDFIFYDPPDSHPDEAGFDALGLKDCVFQQLLPGFGLTVRRCVALKEPFETAFLSYSPAEDLDASYRWSRHGYNCLCYAARLHHVEAAPGRVKRRVATTLRLLNVGYLVRKHGRTPWKDVPLYYVFLTRRSFAELLKDALSGRWTFPQFRGALGAIWRSPGLFRQKRATMQDWYRGVQQEILDH